MSNSDDPFTILKHEHTKLDRLFLLHQEMLVNRSWVRAMRLLEVYQQRLAAHIHIEDHVLLPYCVAGSTGAVRWEARVYTAEHRRLEELVDKARAHLAAIRRRGVKSAMLIGLLDEEKTVKNVLEHHHEREEKGLYDELRGHLPAEVSQHLMAALLANAVHVIQ